MAKYVYVVQSNPVPGKEDQYNDWYRNVHLNDVLKVNGFTGAQLFRHRPVDGLPGPELRYMALYDVDTDDLEATVAHNQHLATETDEMPMTDAFDVTSVTRHYFEPITTKHQQR